MPPAGVAGTMPAKGKCQHLHTRNLYDQRPPSEGRKLVPAARLCEDCGEPLRLKGA
jgi:hypothetical protein